MCPATLRALLFEVIDYAGMFPPAALPCSQAATNYLDYLNVHESWMLRYFVINAADVEKLPDGLSGLLSILSDVEHLRASVLESKKIIATTKPVYCELPIAELPAVKAAGNFAKLRTGSLQASGIPSVASVAEFILKCAELKLPYKATAGLHHAIRGSYRLTYEPDSPIATMHGFLNVIFASCLAYHGKAEILSVLEETNLHAFQFDDQTARCQSHTLTLSQIKDARQNFFHSFGSCSFAEPVEELRAAGWLFHGNNKPCPPHTHILAQRCL